MATTNRFQIGLTSGSLINMPYPSKDPLPKIKNEFYTVDEGADGSRRITYLKTKKVDWVLNFRNKPIADYNTLLAYADVPQQYYVRLKNSDSSQLLADGFYFITTGEEITDVNSDDFRYNFTFNLIQL